MSFLPMLLISILEHCPQRSSNDFRGAILKSEFRVDNVTTRLTCTHRSFNSRRFLTLYPFRWITMHRPIHDLLAVVAVIVVVWTRLLRGYLPHSRYSPTAVISYSPCYNPLDLIRCTGKSCSGSSTFVFASRIVMLRLLTVFPS